MFEKPNDEHQWLDQLIGDWTCESECDMGPDQPPMKSSGTESVRSLGGLWTVGEGTFGVGEMASVSIMTLGYDSKKKKYVGTFIVSMMSYLWPYEGQLDDTKTKLVLDSVGLVFQAMGAWPSIRTRSSLSTRIIVSYPLECSFRMASGRNSWKDITIALPRCSIQFHLVRWEGSK